MNIRIEPTPPTPYGLGWFFVEGVNGNSEYTVSIKEVPEAHRVYVFRITGADRKRFSDLPKEGYVFIFVDKDYKLLFGEIRDNLSGCVGENVPLPITDVAIRFHGAIYSLPKPNRHHDVIRKIVEATDVRYVDAHDEDQGFLDESGKYLTRKQGLRVASLNNQMRPEHPIWHNELYSENLW